VAAVVVEKAVDYLDIPIVRVGACVTSQRPPKRWHDLRG